METYKSSYSRFLDGDEDAFTEIVKEFRPQLRLYINSIVHDIDLADEITQDVFVKLVLKRPKDKGNSSFKTWLFTIGRNLAIDNLRKKQKTRFVDFESQVDITDLRLSPEESALKLARAQAVKDAMKRLKPEHREVLTLVYYDEFELAEVARIIKKTNHNTSALLYRAKQALKEELEKEEM